MKKNVFNLTNDTMCQMTTCPKRGECVRHQKYLEALAKKEMCLFVLNSERIEPTETGCPYGMKSEVQRIAYGFKNLYETVPRRNSGDFHTKVPISSQSEYYRYKNGTKGMDQAMQERILKAFAEQGANIDVGFDHYRDELVELPF